MSSLSSLARAALPLAILATGCQTTVAASLEEPEANRVVVALATANIEATKEVDPGSEGRFRVTVARDDVARTLVVMHEEDVPRERTPGVLEALGKGALVPSAAAEHAQFVAGLAGDIQQTLEAIDGVVRARVLLQIPVTDPLAREAAKAQKATASVLLEHRGAAPPAPVEAIQKLVAGGVANLAPADVTVVTIARPAPAALPESELAHVGPFTVARGTVSMLRGAFIAVFLVVVGLIAAVLLLWRKLRALGSARGEDAAGADRPRAPRAR